MCESEFSESDKDLKLEGIKYPKHLLKKNHVEGDLLAPAEVS